MVMILATLKALKICKGNWTFFIFVIFHFKMIDKEVLRGYGMIVEVPVDFKTPILICHHQYETLLKTYFKMKNEKMENCTICYKFIIIY